MPNPLPPAPPLEKREIKMGSAVVQWSTDVPDKLKNIKIPVRTPALPERNKLAYRNKELPEYFQNSITKKQNKCFSFISC